MIRMVTWDVTFESFGVRIEVSADTAEVIERIPGLLPPGAEPCPSSTADEAFAVLAGDGGSYRFMRSGFEISTGLDLELVLTLLENQIRIYLGLHAPNMIFVHAGVVVHDGRAIVIPGLSLAGKSTLVFELVRAGAGYYSDEYAVLDERGLVHAYPTAVSLRGSAHPGRADADRLHLEAGGPPVATGIVLITTYRPGAQWRPTKLSAGRGALAMLANTLAALKRSAEATRVIAQAIDGAVILEGERGEARELVPRLLTGDLS